MSSRGKNKIPAWYERLHVKKVFEVEGENDFRYEVGVKEDRITGAVWLFIAKVIPRGNYAKTVLRIPLKIAKEIAEKVLEL
ncbi:MAG: hypothetical protein J7J22_04635 [Candidatus Verstraetearchaeota archaeon]|nr:hypothetical protein [Candidatus Verstraetearchaeota archaeon]